MPNPDPACLAGLLLLAGASPAGSAETGFLHRTVTVAGQACRYQVHVPAEYETRRQWPVILFLHGAGERGTDGLRQTSAALGLAIRRQPRRYPAIVVFPQVPPGAQWVGPQADLALAALDQTLEEFHGDPDRVYLTGYSMGGHGAWYLAYRHPERFAAVAPICGWTDQLPALGFLTPVVPADQGPPLPALVRRLAGKPIWIFHGEMDPVVPVAASRGPAAALREASSSAQYTEFLGLDHNTWDATYASDAFVRWLFAQRRPGP